MFIFVRMNRAEHRSDDSGHVNIQTSNWETVVTRLVIVLLITALVVVFALLAAAAAGTLARIDGATYPAAFIRGATAFATVVTMATAAVGVLSQCVS
ncbi:hypothetical protein AB0H29_08865 [Streptomyces thermolilacinus]